MLVPVTGSSGGKRKKTVVRRVNPKPVCIVSVAKVAEVVQGVQSYR